MKGDNLECYFKAGHNFLSSRMPDSQSSREHGLESLCCSFEAWAISFCPDVTVHRINKYLAIDSIENVSE